MGQRLGRRRLHLHRADVARRALRHNIVLAPGNVFSPAQAWPDYLRFNAPQSQHQRLFEFLKAELKSRA